MGASNVGLAVAGRDDTLTTHRIDIARLMRPRSLAIVGISPEPGSPGGGVLENLERYHYGGEIHLVSRNRREVKGRPCVASIDDLPEGVDTVLLMTPRPAIEPAISACARRRVGGVIIFAAGFAEAGGEWSAAQERIAAVARDAGMALCGPNCLGIMNYVDGIPLTFSPQQPPPYTPPLAGEGREGAAPSVSIVAQSGGLSSILRTALLAKNLPVAFAVSTGNEAVLGLEDYLEFLLDDAMTRVMTVFAEQIRRPQRFLRLAARAREAGKAIVLLHPGRSAAARAAAQSHTGALAGDQAIMRALVVREGVIAVDGLDELIDVSELMARFPSTPAAGPAVLTDSGAFKGMTLDLAEAVGLELPPLSPATAERLKAELPDFMAPGNPLDLTAQGILDLDLYARTLRPLFADAAFGSVFVAPIVSANSAFAAAKIAAILKAVTGAGKPAILGLLGEEVALPPGAVEKVRAAGIPLFRSPERGLRALARITSHARTAGRMRTPPLPMAAPALPGSGVLPEHVAKSYLKGLGIPVPTGAVTQDLAAAQATAAQTGYPVALKLQAAAMPHKSDAGGVVLDVGDPEALASAWRRMHESVLLRHPGIVIDGVLVEAMAKGGLEMIVGARRDPDWGPVVVVGLGGIWAEALRDILVLPPDLDPSELGAALKTLKAAPLLEGTRGAPARDVGALIDIVGRIGSLVRARPEITEIEINPLVVFERGAGVLALDALIVVQERP
jgi:acyl-CoA synthetase (NDP forming)